MSVTDIITIAAAMMCAFFISVTATPIVRVLAHRVGAVDVPKDNRRMHKVPMPLMGGFAIFVSFVVTSLCFSPLTKPMAGMLIGAFLIIVTGIIDDIYDIKPFAKLAVEIIAALVAVSMGITIERINIFGTYLEFGVFSIPVTVLWIVALTNAVNLIDGLDGLSCGVSTISAMTLLVSLFFLEETSFSVILLTGILAGSCAGFLPFNFNPAKIFMGDTGALFLGYTLSVLSIQGLFKINAVVSFWVPFLVFALPLGDTSFAFLRRLLHGKNPFQGDRGHLHHRLIDMGFDQKHSVMILYAFSGMFGISAILIAMKKYIGGTAIILCAVFVFLAYGLIMTKGHASRGQLGFDLKLPKPTDETDCTGESESGSKSDSEIQDDQDGDA